MQYEKNLNWQKTVENNRNGATWERMPQGELLAR